MTFNKTPYQISLHISFQSFSSTQPWSDYEEHSATEDSSF